MSWLLVAVITAVDWFIPARSSDIPKGLHVKVAAVALGFSLVVDVLVAVAVVLHLPQWAWIPGGIFGSLACVLIADGFWYLFHRASHHPFLWPFHRWHHAAEVMNVWVFYLAHPVFQALAAVVRYLPIWLLGASTAQLAFVGGVQFSWSVFAHANVNVRLLWLEGWLLGPASHAWHHARGSHVNFGILLGVWDRLGGTLRVPSSNAGARRLVRYGVRDPGPDAWDIPGQLRYPFLSTTPTPPFLSGKR